MHRAIQTFYKGRHFRSRLEARWAVAFDALGILWEYEPEGFEFEDGTRYLPDFRLSDHHPGSDHLMRWWIEIKPTPPEGDDLRKLRLLAREQGNVVVVVGALGQRYSYWKEIGSSEDEDGPMNYLFERCQAITDCIAEGDGASEGLIDVPARLQQAAQASMSARFEFGQSGAR